MSTRASRANQPGGFTILEVLVSLVIAGLLMAAIGMVMTQVVQNDAMLEEVQGASTRTATLRRMLHRDFQGMQGDIEPTPDGFTFPSTHNLLMDGPLTVQVSWSFTGGRVRRAESHEDMEYRLNQVLASGLKMWRMSVLDLKRNRWIDLLSAPLDQLDVQAGAVRLDLVLGGEALSILERIPYAWLKPE
jgi:prepilin-type N-terminal cleavage/methylation domain-containing protein